MWGAWQSPPYTGSWVNFRSRKKPEVRKRALSRDGGPLTVTDVSLMALTKILLAAGVL